MPSDLWEHYTPWVLRYTYRQNTGGRGRLISDFEASLVNSGPGWPEVHREILSAERQKTNNKQKTLKIKRNLL